MTDAERFDPALLAERQCYEEAQLHQFGNRKMLVQPLPKRVGGDVGIPGDGTRISERDLFAFRKFGRVREVEQIVVLRFRESLPSSLDGSLDASIFAIDGLGDINPA